MICPLTQLGVNMEEIRNRLNTSTEEYVKIVTIMPSIANAEDRRRFTDMMGPVLIAGCYGWTLSITSRPNQMLTLVYLSNTW